MCQYVVNTWLIGPCVETSKLIPKNSARLVYLDPPFLTGKKRVGSNPIYNYDDSWENHLNTYLPWLEENLKSLIELLLPNGSLILHLDTRAVHYAKVLLDKLLGYKNFMNEIIWHYTGGGRAKRKFSNKHDTLLWYSKGKNPVFNIDAIRVPYKPTSGYAKNGIISAGKKYLPNPKGTPIDDVWDIPIVNPLSKERVGYPSQKPLALLERIILALTNEGDLVVDLFCGSGTTLIAAQKHNRRWIGGDISEKAIECAKIRMNALLTNK